MQGDINYLFVVRERHMFKTLRLNIFLNRLGIFAAVVLLSSCYVGPGSLSALSIGADPHVYKLYPGKELAESEIVKINMVDAYYVIIDDYKVTKSDYQQVLVLPGEHLVRWGKEFMISVMVDSSMFREGEGRAVVNLIAGHTYELYADRTTGHGYSMFFWIQDAKSGEVIAGTKKP
jgi:hypothetical protein